MRAEPGSLWACLGCYSIRSNHSTGVWKSGSPTSKIKRSWLLLEEKGGNAEVQQLFSPFLGVCGEWSGALVLVPTGRFV